jgi:hypothetical protein
MMKFFTFFILAFSFTSLSSQTVQIDTIKGDLSFTQQATVTGGTIVTTPASAITKNTTLTNNKIWILKGFVYVRSGATLTIQNGTIIRGDKGTKAAIIVARGGKIIAEGTPTRPIVFTSNQPVGDRRPGDWGGIIILGKAKNNGNFNNIAGELQIEGGVDTPEKDGIHGGNDDNDNSGVLKYVRIEYAGVAFVPNSEINGLTMGSVGRGTKIDYVQVSFCGDDSFEWFGGNVDSKYLVSLGTTDDDFDTDNGFSGRVQFGIALRDQRYSDVSGNGSSPGDSNGFESDNNSGGTDVQPYTSATFSNMTILGLSTATQPSGQYFNTGARLRRNTRQSIFNSVIMGFPNAGLLVENPLTGTAAVNDLLRLRNNLIAGNGASGTFTSIRPFTSGTGAPTVTAQNWLMTAAYKNDTSQVATSLLEEPFNLTAPKFAHKAGSAAATGAEFTDSYLNIPFFEKVTFKGAYSPTSTWLNTWTNFNPQNTDYSRLNTAIAELSADVFNALVYPNPAKDNATLQFSVEKDMTLQVKVYDLMGREVAIHNNQRYAKGTYTIDLNTNQLANGLYFINFLSNEGQKTMRFSIAK